jgi:hypothetical protein
VRIVTPRPPPRLPVFDHPVQKPPVPGQPLTAPGQNVAFRMNIATQRGRMMRIDTFCFTIAGLAGLSGMVLGIVMGMSQDFTLAPAHAHINLLGWVSMALYGLYHRAAGPARALAWTQAVCGAIAVPLMGGGLAAYLATGSHALQSAVIAGSLFALGGMILFIACVIADALQGRAGRPGGAGLSPAQV